MALALTRKIGSRALSAVLLVVAAVLAGAGLAFLSASATLDAGRVVSGSYEAEALAPDGSITTIRMPVPGLFHDQRLSHATRVRVRVPVELSGDDGASVAVFVDRFRHVLVARWDGATFGSLGEARGTSVVRGRDGSFLAAVPAALTRPGPHLLELEVTGAWDDGGLLGELRVGETTALARLQQWREFERMGLVIVGIFASLVHLSVAMRRPGRWDHLLLGLIVACFSMYLFGLSDSWWVALDDSSLGARLRIRRGGLMAAIGLCVILGARIGMGRVNRPGGVLVAAIGGVMLIDVAAPDLWWNTVGNRVGDYLCVVATFWVGGCAVVGMRAQRPGSGALATTVLVALCGALFDILVSRGIWRYSPLTMPSHMAVWGTLAASIGLRDTDAHERYEALVTQASDAILRVTLAGDLIEWNAAALRVLGPKLTGTSLFDVAAPEEAAILRQHLAAARRAPGAVELSLADGRRVEASTSRLDDGGLLMIVRDVTDRRRVQEGLLRAARMESVGQLAGGIAHDFNNVLGGVLGQVSLMRLQYGAEGDLDSRLERLERTLLRATGLCRRLLTLARGGSPARVRLDPGVLVEAALELMRPAIEPVVRLRVDVARGLPPVTVVPSEVEEVLMNLAVNARDASPPRAEVLLEVRREGDGVAFAVEDRGDGVPDELRERIFEPFYTTKGIGQGTGLGLAVVTRVVRDHGGHVRVERSSLGGARFVVWFPASAEQDALVAPDVRAHPVGCVFVVDDEPLVRDAAADVLRHAGCDVRAFGSASEALAAAQACHPAVLVTDVVMPGTDGLALAKAIGAEHPGARVILMSGYIPDTEPWGELRDGRWAVLPKPFRGDDLVRMVLGVDSPRTAVTR